MRKTKLGFQLREPHKAVSNLALISTILPVYVVLVSFLVFSIFVACKKSTAPKAANVIMRIQGCESRYPLSDRLVYTLENTGNKTAYNVRPWAECNRKGQYLSTVEAIDPGIKVNEISYISYCPCIKCKVFWD